MNERKWQQFFDLLAEIVDGQGAVSEKVTEVRAQAAEYGESAEANLEEFTAWDWECV